MNMVTLTDELSIGNTVEIIIGIAIGIIIGIFYIRIFCTVYKGPDSNEIKNWVYEWNDKGTLKYIKLYPVIKIGPQGAKHY